MKVQRSIQMYTYIIATLLFLSITSSCVTTRVEANPYQDSAVNIECQRQSSWSYFWGLKQQRVNANPEVEGAVCPCRGKAMSWVVTKSSFGDFLLSLVTLGTVNHRTVSYGCAREQDGDGGLDD